MGCKIGCDCAAARGGGEAKPECQCKCKALLDDKGCYFPEKLEGHDQAWARQCASGLEWEILSWRMDEEEPDAALVIGVALNKRNEAAMKTGILEIMSTLKNLCKPGPDQEVLFEPVRDKMIDMYGADVDHPDFLQMFKFVCDAGGPDSIHLKDLFAFTTGFVNPHMRKMRMEAFGVIAQYPLEFPRIKNASMKWAWKQDTTRGWCQLPCNIMHRFLKGQKFQMYSFLQEVETVFLELSKLAATVVAPSAFETPEKAEKAKIQWVAEVDIGVMAKIQRAAPCHPP